MKKILNPDEYIGKKLGKLTMLSYIGIRYNKVKYIKVKCDCGKEFDTTLTKFINNKVTQCKDCAKESRKTHGLSNTRLYHVWEHMKYRCNNPKCANFINYGGRGIKICEEWNKSSSSFIKWALSNGYKNDLTLDRIDNNGNYEPNNCRWATYEQQSVNQRKSKRNSSGYVGIGFRKDTKKWTSFIHVHKKRIILGCFNTQKEALEIRNKYIKNNNLEHHIQKYMGEIGIK